MFFLVFTFGKGFLPYSILCRFLLRSSKVVNKLAYRRERVCQKDNDAPHRQVVPP